MSKEIRRFTFTHSPLSSAVWTGLEPATPCVTGRYSNRLNYRSALLFRWERGEYYGFPSTPSTLFLPF